jgi:hypothetical protein
MEQNMQINPKVIETWYEHKSTNTGESIEISELNDIFITTHTVPYEFTDVLFWSDYRSAHDEAKDISKSWETVYMR